jgi:iron complex outermembrane receptor protein
LYGEAYRAPNAYELYYHYPGVFKANPSLRPEDIRTYELVWEQGLPGDLDFSAAAYRYDCDNLTAQVRDPGDGLLVFRNLNSAKASGVELGLERRSAGGIATRLSYAWQSAEDSTTDLELSNSPRHLAKLSFTAPLGCDQVWAGVNVQYSSPVQTVRGTESDEMVIVNATLFARPFGRHWEASASVYNLFDERSGYSGSTEHLQNTIPLPGRSFRVKVTCRF